MYRHFFLSVITALFILLLSNCTIHKRHYLKGYYIPSLHKQLASPIFKQDKNLGTAVICKDSIPKGCDTLLLKDGTSIACKIETLNDSVTQYRYCNNPEGPLYIVKTKKINSITYANHKKILFVQSKPIDVSTIKDTCIHCRNSPTIYLKNNTTLKGDVVKITPDNTFIRFNNKINGRYTKNYRNEDIEYIQYPEGDKKTIQQILNKRTEEQKKKEAGKKGKSLKGNAYLALFFSVLSFILILLILLFFLIPGAWWTADAAFFAVLYVLFAVPASLILEILGIIYNVKASNLYKTDPLKNSRIKKMIIAATIIEGIILLGILFGLIIGLIIKL